MKIGFFFIFFNPQYNALKFKSALMVQWQVLVRGMKISFTLLSSEKKRRTPTRNNQLLL